MIYIVDGTGDSDDDKYAEEMSNSFCKQLQREVGIGRAKYWRGPSLSGIEVPSIVQQVVHSIKAKQDQCRVGLEEPIFLCGYSRGGLAVIEAARKIQPLVINAMFLFDAVDKALGPDGEVISGNVRKVYFAKRDPEFSRRHEAKVEATRDSLQQATKKMDESRNRFISAFLGPDPDAAAVAQEAINVHAIERNKDSRLKFISRNRVPVARGISVETFGNTGLRVEPPGQHEMAEFKGSHGALGGVPWADEDIPGDKDVVPAVRSWMWARFIKEGVLADTYDVFGKADRAQRTA